MGRQAKVVKLHFCLLGWRLSKPKSSNRASKCSSRVNENCGAENGRLRRLYKSVHRRCDETLDGMQSD